MTIVLKDRLFLLVETNFLASGNHFLPLSQIFLKKSFILFSGNAFFSPKERVVSCSELFLLLVVTIIQIIEKRITAISNLFL